MEKLIDSIISTEWNMFHSTQNIGGTASCQNDKRQFEIMRRAQFMAWNKELLASYLSDLENAEAERFNLAALKYGYMMKSTDPAGYVLIEDQLPAISQEKQQLIDALAKQTVEWAEEWAAKYPKLAAHGRPVHSSEDLPWTTSIETYCRGELSTYSVGTLTLLSEHYSALAAKGHNLHLQVIENELKLSGMASLEKVEAALKSGQ